MVFEYLKIKSNPIYMAMRIDGNIVSTYMLASRSLIKLFPWLGGKVLAWQPEGPRFESWRCRTIFSSSILQQTGYLLLRIKQLFHLIYRKSIIIPRDFI